MNTSPAPTLRAATVASRKATDELSLDPISMHAEGRQPELTSIL